MGAQEVTVTLQGAKRRTNTADGNPRWLLVTEAGSYLTAPDVQTANSVPNHAADTFGPTSWVARPVVLTLDGSGRVRFWRRLDGVRCECCPFAPEHDAGS